MSCFGRVGETMSGTVGAALEGCIVGVITSTYNWVAVPMMTFAWVGAVGGICGGVTGGAVVVALRRLGISESVAKIAGIIVALGVSVIVQGAIFMGAGMTAGAAFTASAATLIIPAAVIAGVVLVVIATTCIQACCC